MDNRPWEDVEKAVLKVYRNTSPSFQNIENKNTFESFKTNRNNLLKRLAFPMNLMQGKRILDIGGGTGENLVLYAEKGAHVTLLEPNEISCDRAKNLMQKNNFKLDLINNGLFDIDEKIIGEYDIVFCEDVLHHTYDPLVGLNIILKNLKQGSIVVVSLAEKSGHLKRLLQRTFVRNNGKISDEEEITKVAKKYFQDHLNKAVNLGLRSEKSVIYDTYINPQVKPSSLEDICNVFFKNNIQYLCSYPRLGSFLETFSWRNGYTNPYDYESYKNYYKILEKIWAVSGSEDFDENHESLDIVEFINKVNIEYKELINLEEKIYSNICDEKDLIPLQKGYLGVGTHYFTGYKPLKIK